MVRLVELRIRPLAGSLSSLTRRSAENTSSDNTVRTGGGRAGAGGKTTRDGTSLPVDSSSLGPIRCKSVSQSVRGAGQGIG